jgi:adenylate kinase
MARNNPNIVVTGTPGVGKTTHAEQLASDLGFKHISVNQIVKDEGFHEGKDEETGSWVVDEDKVWCSSQVQLSCPSEWASRGNVGGSRS